MKKVILVKGMNCQHCKMSVEKSLNELANVSNAKVDLAKNNATVTYDGDISDDALRTAVMQAGFTATNIVIKKGLFK